MNPDNKLDVVFDCNTFLQGTARQTGPAFACLQGFRNGEFTLHYSSDILEEVRDVLSRPALQQKFDALTPAVVELTVTKHPRESCFHHKRSRRISL